MYSAYVIEKILLTYRKASVKQFIQISVRHDEEWVIRDDTIILPHI